MSDLFRHRGRHPDHSAKRRQPSAQTLDRFAELLSHHDAGADPPDHGGNAARCAVMMGFSASYGRVLLQRLVRKMGDQAR